MRLARRFLVAGLGAAALLCGASAGAVPDPDAPSVAPEPADAGRAEWFGSPVSGVKYTVGRDEATGAKWLLAPDGRRFPSVGAILEEETRRLPAEERLFAPDLLALMRDPSRAEELVDVTFIFRSQPLHDAAAAARERANPAIEAAIARQHAILDRIGPLRTLPGGRAPDVAEAMREEAALLTDEEKTELRATRDAVLAALAAMRREALAEATPLVERDQEPLALFLREVPRAIDFGGSVTLSARSARVPVGLLAALGERFPEVLRIDRMGHAEGQMDTALQTIGVSGWWNASYIGSSSTKIAVLDTGIDSSHPALNGMVSASAIHLSAGVALTNFNDSTTNADDLQGHGTRAAGILCSTDSTYRGIAYGGTLLNVKCGYLTNAAAPPTQTMQFADGRAGGDWAFNNGATSVSLSFAAGGSYSGTQEWSLFFDAGVQALAVPAALVARNDGPTSSTIGQPGDGFNIVTCGAFDDNATSSLSDDALSTTSGRGPTADGRQKPDLCGPGANITTTEYDWEGSNPDFGTSLSGTSNVTPLVTGLFSLIQHAGAVAYPEGMKALLLTTTRTATPYGGPDNSWGYGAMNCGGAYTYRGSVYQGQLTSSGPRYLLLRGGSLASGARATLVWNRHVTSAGAAVPTTYYAPQDLDLYVYEEATGASAGSSTSTLNPNEQITTTAAVTSPIYKVILPSGSFTSVYSTEPFALASESTGSVAAVTPPALSCSMDPIPAAVAASAQSTVTVTVTNTGGFKAFAPVVTLNLPSNYTLVSGTNPRTLSDLAPTASAQVTWTIRSGAGPSGTVAISAGAVSTTFGESIASALASRNQIVDVDPPTASIDIAGGAAYTTSRDVVVSLTASDVHTSVAQMRVRNAGAAWGAWVAYSGTANLTLPAAEGTRTVEAEFTDAVGNASSTASDGIVLDTAAPAGSLTVAGGAAFVNDPAVVLACDVADVTSGLVDARFSNDGVAWTDWSAHAPTQPWTLTAGDGPKTVRGQFRDAAGNVSETLSDDVFVETVAPAGTIVIAGGAAGVSVRDVTLTLSASDAASGVAAMRFSDDGTSFGDWRAYAASAPWTLPPGDGTKTVYAQFRDNAGNVSASASDQIDVDTGPPTGTLLIDDDARFTNTASVTFTLSASDTQNGVVEMRFSNDAVNWSPWTSYAASASWTLAPGDGLRRAFVQYKDGVGNVSGPISDAINVDTVVPTGTVAIEAGAAAINTADVALELKYADPGSGVAEVRLSNDGTQWSAWTAVAASLPWTMQAGEGVRTVHVQYKDGAGNESVAVSDTILEDLTPPTGTFALAGGASYVMPWETLAADGTADDGAAGSGVASFRSSYDDGATWSPWAPLAAGRATVPRPPSGADRTVTIRGQFRDVAGNVSDDATDATFLVAAEADDVTAIGSYAGQAGVGGDVDAVRMSLVAGDALTLKLKLKALVAKSAVTLDVDVYGPDRQRIVTGRHPSGAKKPGVTKLVVPATGEYFIVMRAAGAASGSGIAYAMTVAPVAAKGTRALKGSAPVAGGAATIEFDGYDGLKLTGTLTVTDLAAQPVLVAPDGSTVPLVVVRGTKGPLKFSAPSLTGGVGRYRLSVASGAAVAYSVVLTAPKRGKDAESPGKDD